jgi:hypothetical protein
MIGKIIDALQAFEYYGQTETIEIAKGKYELVKDCKDLKVKIKRSFKFILR